MSEHLKDCDHTFEMHLSIQLCLLLRLNLFWGCRFDLVRICGGCKWMPLKVALPIPSPSMDTALALQPFRIFDPLNVHLHSVRTKFCCCVRLVAVKLKPLRVSMNFPLSDTIYSGLVIVSISKTKQFTKKNGHYYWKVLQNGELQQ